MKLVEKVKRMNLLDKFRNKKVFALYLVGVLVLSMGVSFAYFSANSSVTGNGSVATNITATIETKGITADGNIDFNNVDMYPGHTAIASIRVTGTGNNEPLMYNVIFNGSSTFTTPLNYTVYKSDANIDASYSCEIRQGRIGTSRTYYEECSGNNIESLGSPISSGTINNGSGKTILKSDEIMLTAPEGEVVYYYIVIEYPNLDANQNDDMGSSINGNITIEEGSEYQKPAISMVASTVSGNNNWYTSASVITNITTQTNNYEAYYCTTTNNSCTPDTQVNVSDNSFTTSLSSNASPQKVCVRVVDEYNQTAEGCSEAYSVDTVNPTISITSTSATENSISVTVSGSDVHSGIYQYRFSSNGGSSYTTVTTSNSSYTYTFNNLESGTSYNIAVQSVDRSGRTSSRVTRNVITDINYCPEGSTACNTILANKTISDARNGAITGTLTTNTTGTVYRVADDDGDSYVFAGAPTDNWVSFAGFYWRIIRINGDGSIRLIYNGNSTATTGEGTMINSSQAFNTNYDDNAYVGYMYGSTRANSYASTHTNTNNSSIKTVVDNWYRDHLLQYAQYISTEAGFCGDRKIASGYSGYGTLGYGTNATVYAPTSRFMSADWSWLGTQHPTLKCSQSNDLYTVSGSSKGNHALTYPIGLITADEVVLAGGFGGATNSNSSYYLYNNAYYWLMTPSYLVSDSIVGSHAGVFAMYPDGNLYHNWGNNTFGVRPVINLSADVTITGTGTMSDPYVVS